MVKKKGEICGLHCPKYMLWLFAIMTGWFTLSAFGVATFGGFWSWAVLLSGVCTYVCATSEAHKKTACPFSGCPAWTGIVLAVVGLWFVLGDAGIMSTYGVSLLYLVAFIATLGALNYNR